MSEAVNQTELRVVGMSRSGNHAIINWILRQISGRFCFLNCAEPKTNPFETARPLADGTRVITNLELSEGDELEGRFTPRDWLLLSHEDCFLGMVSTGAYEERHDEFVGPSRTRRDLLVLRDPFNLFASRLKSGYSGVTPTTAKRMWKQHAREYLGELSYLGPDRLAVSYNDWSADLGYRKELAEELALEFSDRGIDEVPQTGGGSSFDRLRFHGRASQMKVLERWRAFADNPEFQDLLDDEIVELSERIFGRIPGTEVLRNQFA